MHVEPVITALPPGFEVLRAEALAEGFQHIETLHDEWDSGANRFTRPGEQLLAAFAENELAGIGGITVDYALSDGLRMRRFYIRPGFRRLGVGRLLATTLLAYARSLGRSVTLRAPYPDAAAFWETMGFVREECEDFTHILRR
ncbi:MAG TPA: GNAT family N-acetyltransferase [Devosia sp.]